jgi:hypothetical protein
MFVYIILHLYLLMKSHTACCTLHLTGHWLPSSGDWRYEYWTNISSADWQIVAVALSWSFKAFPVTLAACSTSYLYFRVVTRNFITDYPWGRTLLHFDSCWSPLDPVHEEALTCFFPEIVCCWDGFSMVKQLRAMCKRGRHWRVHILLNSVKMSCLTNINFKFSL